MNFFELSQILYKKNSADRSIKTHHFSSHSRLLNEYQLQRLQNVIAQASKNSKFFSESYSQFQIQKPEDLLKLPVMTKSWWQEHFDQLVPAIKRNKALESVDRGSVKIENHRVMTTSGTTGERGLFVFSKNDWYELMSSYLRAYEMAGRKFSVFRPLKSAMIGSDQLWHQSTQIANYAQSRFFPTLKLSVLESEDLIVQKLNMFQPDILAGYSGYIRLLALRALSGDLLIKPQSIICSAEALTAETRELCLQAWGVNPFNLYASTEFGVMGMECSEHNGLHLFFDRMHIEIVDKDNRHVDVGTRGDKILVTSLSSRTMPLIRYEMSDCLQLKAQPCSCGRSLPLIENIQGRAQDQLHFSDSIRQKTVHPSVFYALMEKEWVRSWQVRQVSSNSLDILIETNDLTTVERVKTSLRSIMSLPDYNFIESKVISVTEIPKGKNGKRKLIVTQDQVL